MHWILLFLSSLAVRLGMGRHFILVMEPAKYTKVSKFFFPLMEILPEGLIDLP